MKVVVLAGGISTERDVSFSTGKNVYTALKENGHKVVLIDSFLGYTGDVEGIFEKEIDWAEQIGNVQEINPDIEAVKKLSRR